MIDGKSGTTTSARSVCTQAQQTWVAGKSAMTVTAGTDVKQVREAGRSRSKVGLMTMPKFGNGVGAGKLGATSQTIGMTSSKSPYKKEAAAFIEYLHTAPDALSLFYKDTGALPADDRFNASQVTVPQIKQLFSTWRRTGLQYLENFIPFDLDQKGNFAGVQLCSPADDDAAEGCPAMEIDMARIR